MIYDFFAFLQENRQWRELFQFGVMVIAGLSFIIISGIIFKRSKTSTKALAYAGLALAIAFILSNFRLYRMPWGGSVTLMSMFFVSFVGFMYGPKIGLVAAISYGFLQFAQRPEVFHPIQVLLDYPVAFGLLGLAGFFWKKPHGLYIGFVVGVIGRWFASTMAGIFFFAQFAPEGWGAIPYAMAYNAAFMFTEMGITLVILLIPQVRAAIFQIRNQAQG
ncbi:MAG: energy-coupled thiamine transporter ThiT, partial [Defluviitaleaceae bacterium]|nr:energy-coupled thiamine transporter ThiT [Defluviitaleaceae bacterium]